MSVHFCLTMSVELQLFCSGKMDTDCGSDSDGGYNDDVVIDHIKMKNTVFEEFQMILPPLEEFRYLSYVLNKQLFEGTFYEDEIEKGHRMFHLIQDNGQTMFDYADCRVIGAYLHLCKLYWKTRFCVFKADFRALIDIFIKGGKKGSDDRYVRLTNCATSETSE